MRRAPVDLARILRKAVEGLASYKMVPAVYRLPDTTGCQLVCYGNMDNVFAAQGLT